MPGKAFLFVAIVVGSSLAACGRGPDPSETKAVPEKVEVAAHPALKPLAGKKFGAEITEKTSVALDALLREPAKFQTRTVRTEGTVSAVCKAMGCWMELADAAGQAHVRMAGHSFFVPRDASGHHAVVQGTVIRNTDDECSQEAKQQTGAVAKIEIEATGVEFVD